MKKEYRIVHISDLHLNSLYFPERTTRFRLLLQQCKRMNFDHIVITGDITDQAKKEEFEHFRSVLNEFSLLDGKKVTAVIGMPSVKTGKRSGSRVILPMVIIFIFFLKTK